MTTDEDDDPTRCPLCLLLRRPDAGAPCCGHRLRDRDDALAQLPRAG